MGCILVCFTVIWTLAGLHKLQYGSSSSSPRIGGLKGKIVEHVTSHISVKPRFRPLRERPLVQRYGPSPEGDNSIGGSITSSGHVFASFDDLQKREGSILPDGTSINGAISDLGTNWISHDGFVRRKTAEISALSRNRLIRPCSTGVGGVPRITSRGRTSPRKVTPGKVFTNRQIFARCSMGQHTETYFCPIRRVPFRGEGERNHAESLTAAKYGRPSMWPKFCSGKGGCSGESTINEQIAPLTEIDKLHKSDKGLCTFVSNLSHSNSRRRILSYRNRGRFPSPPAMEHTRTATSYIPPAQNIGFSAQAVGVGGKAVKDGAALPTPNNYATLPTNLSVERPKNPIGIEGASKEEQPNNCLLPSLQNTGERTLSANDYDINDANLSEEMKSLLSFHATQHGIEEDAAVLDPIESVAEYKDAPHSFGQKKADAPSSVVQGRKVQQQPPSSIKSHKESLLEMFDSLSHNRAEKNTDTSTRELHDMVVEGNIGVKEAVFQYPEYNNDISTEPRKIPENFKAPRPFKNSPAISALTITGWSGRVMSNDKDRNKLICFHTPTENARMVYWDYLTRVALANKFVRLFPSDFEKLKNRSNQEAGAAPPSHQGSSFNNKKSFEETNSENSRKEGSHYTTARVDSVKVKGEDYNILNKSSFADEDLQASKAHCRHDYINRLIRKDKTGVWKHLSLQGLQALEDVPSIQRKLEAFRHMPFLKQFYKLKYLSSNLPQVVGLNIDNTTLAKKQAPGEEIPTHPSTMSPPIPEGGHLQTLPANVGETGVLREGKLSPLSQDERNGLIEFGDISRGVKACSMPVLSKTWNWAKNPLLQGISQLQSQMQAKGKSTASNKASRTHGCILGGGESRRSNLYLNNIPRYNPILSEHDLAEIAWAKMQYHDTTASGIDLLHTAPDTQTSNEQTETEKRENPSDLECSPSNANGGQHPPGGGLLQGERKNAQKSIGANAQSDSEQNNTGRTSTIHKKLQSVITQIRKRLASRKSMASTGYSNSASDRDPVIAHNKETPKPIIVTMVNGMVEETLSERLEDLPKDIFIGSIHNLMDKFYDGPEWDPIDVSVRTDPKSIDSNLIDGHKVDSTYSKTDPSELFVSQNPVQNCKYGPRRIVSADAQGSSTTHNARCSAGEKEKSFDRKKVAREFFEELHWIPEYSNWGKVNTQPFHKGQLGRLSSKFDSDYPIFDYRKFDFGMAKMTALNQVGINDVACVYVPENTHVDNPIHILQYYTNRKGGDGERTNAQSDGTRKTDSKTGVVDSDANIPEKVELVKLCNSRLVVKMGKNSKMSLYQSVHGGEKCHVNNATRIVVGEGAEMNHTYVQMLDQISTKNNAANIGDQVSGSEAHQTSREENNTRESNGRDKVEDMIMHWENLSVLNKADAKFMHNGVQIGGLSSRFNCQVECRERSEQTVRGLGLCNTHQDIQRYDMFHVEHSDVVIEQLQKYLVSGLKSNGVWRGRIRIERSGHRCKANSLCRVILLTKGASTLIVPSLEIIPCDVIEANHGAAIHDIEEPPIYYFKSRGISETLARTLVLRSSAMEICKYIPDLHIQQHIDQKVLRISKPIYDPLDPDVRKTLETYH